MKKIYVLFVIAAVLMAVSCNCVNIQNQNENNQVQTHESVLKILFEDSSRTINPTVPVEQLVNFKLTAQKNGEVDENDQPVVHTIGSSSGYANAAALSSEELSLPTGAAGYDWTFTLTADLPGEDNSSTTYTATVNKEIKEGPNAIKFLFDYPADYSQGQGAFSVLFDWSQKLENAGKVSSVKAVLENVADTNSSVNYNSLTISNNKVTVAGNNIPSGSYRLKVYFYKNEAQIAYWQEVINISNSYTTKAAREISSFSQVYSITYNYNAGTDNVTCLCPTTVTRNSKVLGNGLPSRDGYLFINWYLDNNVWEQPFDVSKISEDVDVDEYINVYARWFQDNGLVLGANKENIADKITAASSTDKQNPTLIKVFGEFTQADFEAAAQALKDKEDNDGDEDNDIYIALDFSEVSTNVTAVDFDYFSYCKCLAGIVIPDSFTYTLETNFQINKKQYKGISANNFILSNNLCYINASQNCQSYSSVDGVLFTKDGTRLVAFPSGKECTNDTYSIPSSVTTIEGGAFYDFSFKVKNLIIHENVSVIWPSAFINIFNFDSITFNDTTHAWKRSGSTIYNIQSLFDDYVNRVQSYDSGNTYLFEKTSDTFAGIIANAQVIPANVVTGAGTDETNYNIDTTGYNTVTFNGSYETKWLSFTTTPGKTYYLYCCYDDSGTNNFENIPTDVILCKSPKISMYSKNAEICYLDQESRHTLSFTVPQNSEGTDSAYICIKEGGYFTYANAQVGEKFYFLIREVEP